MVYNVRVEVDAFDETAFGQSAEVGTHHFAASPRHMLGYRQDCPSSGVNTGPADPSPVLG